MKIDFSQCSDLDVAELLFSTYDDNYCWYYYTCQSRGGCPWTKARIGDEWLCLSGCPKYLIRRQCWAELDRRYQLLTNLQQNQLKTVKIKEEIQ